MHQASSGVTRFHGFTNHKSGGFTLVELAVTLTIVAILLAVGIPAFNRFKSNNTLRAAVDTLVADVNLAHSAANGPDMIAGAGKKTRTGFGINNSSAAQTPAPAGAVAFTGYAVFVGDPTGDGVATRDVTFDPSLQVLVAATSVPADFKVPRKFPSDLLLIGDQNADLFFQHNGTLVAGTSTAVVLTNNITQFRVTISKQGNAQVTEEPVGTPP